MRYFRFKQACSLSAVIHGMRAMSSNKGTGDTSKTREHVHVFVTCLSADNVLFAFFLVENNFHQCRHRKVATRHTLPSIQMSLSLRKFSMAQTSLCLSLFSACTSCFLFLRWLYRRSLRRWAACCWHLATQWALIPKHWRQKLLKLCKENQLC